MFVYFVQAGKRGAIKIGIARNIERRILSMQTGNAYELHLLAAIPCKSRAQAKDFEGRLHRFFGRQKIRGEWFMNNINVKKAVDRFSETINPLHMAATGKEI